MGKPQSPPSTGAWQPVLQLEQLWEPSTVCLTQLRGRMNT